MKEGSRTALRDPTSILLSRDLAHSLFGDATALGRTIKMGDKFSLQVKGVYEDLPENSTFANLSFLAPVDLLFPDSVKKNDWYTSAFSIFVQLKPGIDHRAVSAKIAGILAPHQQNNKAVKPRLFLYPMNRWHLYGEFRNSIDTGGNIQYCWMFGIIGVFILLLASINFMNLATARSEKRAKEVGIRKAIGSGRGQLILQFFGESFLMSGCALALSLLLAQGILPFFNEVSGKHLHIPVTSLPFWLASFAFWVIMGFLTGSYPALYLSSFKPVKVLKGAFRPGPGAAVPRKVLVVLQFTVSIALAVGTIIVYRQIAFAQNRPLGYDQDGLVTVPLNTPQIKNNYNAIRDELIRTGAVTRVAESSSPTTAIGSSANNMEWKGKDPNQQASFGTISSSSEFGRTIGWNIKEGRDFSAEYITDSMAFVLNEAAVSLMGLAHPMGERVHWHGKDFTIIGVVKDMVMTSPYMSSSATVFMMNKERSLSVIVLKLNPRENPQHAITAIEKVFKQYNPEIPFEYHFADEDYARKFVAEQRIGRLSGAFSLLALFISCIGIFGMASFVAEQRRKEIGVRKILGASVISVWSLLSREFVVLVLISFTLATPVAAYFMQGWLEHYEYHTTLSWWTFVVAGAGVLLITLLTVSYQALKAALVNPAKSLRSE
jgi:ABC-type antimicrobial peptide transport system permease subunit